MVWLAAGAAVYAVVGLLFVLALCLAASRSSDAEERMQRALDQPAKTEDEAAGGEERGA
jgi:hypothetical protein